MKIQRYGHYWTVYDAGRVLACLCVYERGALEVVCRLTER